MKRSRFFAILSFAFLVASCSETPYFEEYVEIPNNEWHQDSSIFFTVDVDDTTSKFLIGLNLRNNNSYPYSNIFLFREIRSSRGIEFRDTAEFYLANAYGKWLGEGIGELKTNQWVFSKEGVRFRKKDTYTFSITQAMRTERLEGIEDVGITIFKSKSNP